ncbi:uncharacterized protein LOC143036126 [Oratosquilla oratoria]|uniref:uncharacterized protein LOC143036126 n=1 Tax=Oratosquilla oratoria TaxID=337810 RepID=UPI003F76ABC5
MMIDTFCDKNVEEPIPNKRTETITSVIYDQIINFTIPNILVSDNGTEFDQQTWKNYRTINYIINRVYHNTKTPKLPIPESTLRSLLHCCTTESPFTCSRGVKYQQIDGVAMGSPLGVLFANFFMGCIEEVFSKFEKPEIYCRYIDDIFIKTTHNEDIILLKNYLQDASGLTFTIENSVEGSMPFLDILVKQQKEKFDTDTYVKPTNTGQCMNGRSECPQRYINPTISAYIRRDLTHCSTWTKVHTEIVRST